VHHYNTVTQRQFFLYPPSSRLTSHLRCGQVEVRGGTKFGRNPPTTVRQMLENIVNCPIFETGNVILDPNPESHQRQKLIISRRSSIAEVRRTTGCSLLSHLVTNRRLRLFGHIACSSPRKDHHRALAACIRQVPPDWKRPAGRPSHTWLCAIEADLGPLNFGLTTAWRKATTRDERRHIVDTATLQGVRSERRKKRIIPCPYLPTLVDIHQCVQESDRQTERQADRQQTDRHTGYHNACSVKGA